MVLLAAASALGSCEAWSGADTGLVVVESDSAGVAIVSIQGDVSTLPEWRTSDTALAVVSGDDAPFLGDVGEVAVRADGRLLVEDNQSRQLYLFDESGRLMRTVAAAGDGPGELRNLTALTVGPGDTTYAYDRRLGRYSVFGPEGALIATVPVDRDLAGSGALALDGRAFSMERLVLHSIAAPDSTNRETGPRLAQRTAVLHVLSSDGAPHGPGRRLPGGYGIVNQTFDGASPFATNAIVAIGAGMLLRGSGLEYELVLETAALDPVRHVRWSGWREPLVEARVLAVRDSWSAGFEAFRRSQP